MDRALALAGRGRGDTSPNPMVGAIVVADGEAVGEGWHRGPGELHAEAVAIQGAGAAARGAVLYVTLEPCRHHGRTPPCVETIVRAGIGRVVVAQVDPDEKMAGQSLEALREAGVDVTEGVRRAEAERQLEAYRHQRTTGRPLVVLKLAVTIDGAVAAPDGTSQWITGPAARADAQDLRRASDAIVVGSGTVLADDPRLTVRREPPPRRQPLRVVLDRRGRTPETARLFAEPGETLIWTGDLDALMDELASREMLQVLVEGGSTVAGAFLRGGLVDKLIVYLGAALAGGEDARPAFAGPAQRTIGEFGRPALEDVHRLGPDVRLTYRLRD